MNNTPRPAGVKGWEVSCNTNKPKHAKAKKMYDSWLLKKPRTYTVIVSTV